MTLNDRIHAFVALGSFLNQLKTTENKTIESPSHDQEFFERFQNKIQFAKHHNGWFTPENILFAIAQWAEALQQENLASWISNYKEISNCSKTVGIVMAGNIPLVGFHDFLCVLITGHKAVVKLSSNDAQLLPLLAEYLITIAPDFKEYIVFTTEKLPEFDAVIATGSTNTARYFEHYFAHKPHIIRKNRNSVAILTGKETPEEFLALGTDIFQYYGLGCRSVSKLFVPKDYDFTSFFEAIFPFSPIMDSAKYANNYDYNKAVYLMSEFKLWDNGFVMLKEDTSHSSPIATLFYETYENESKLLEHLENEAEKLQCIVGNHFDGATVQFGMTQQPKLHDYADGIDILKFLSTLC